MQFLKTQLLSRIERLAKHDSDSENESSAEGPIKFFLETESSAEGP